MCVCVHMCEDLGGMNIMHVLVVETCKVFFLSFPPTLFRLQGSSEGALTHSHTDVVKTSRMCSVAPKLQGLYAYLFCTVL